MISGPFDCSLGYNPAKMNNQREGEDFFYGVYGAANEGVLTKIRRETYGEDLGQFSWITADELRKFLRNLDLNAYSHVLDVACGSGGPAFFTAQTLGCHGPASKF